MNPTFFDNMLKMHNKIMADAKAPLPDLPELEGDEDECQECNGVGTLAWLDHTSGEIHEKPCLCRMIDDPDEAKDNWEDTEAFLSE
jgi:hypothetical protein